MTVSEEVVLSYKVKSDTEKLAYAILDVMEVAQSHGVRCWLNYGALLGLVRENRLLPWNNDAELTCWFDHDLTQKFKLITDTMNGKGYHTFFYSTLGAISIRAKGVTVNISCYWRDGIYAVRPHETPVEARNATITSRILYWLATFMGAYPSGFAGNCLRPLSNKELFKVALVSTLRRLPVKIRQQFFLKLIHLSGQFSGQFQKTAIPAVYFKNFIMRDFYGGEVLVPENSDELLGFIYGHEWKVPKVDWSFYDDDNKDDTGIKFIDEMWDYSKMTII